MGHRKPIFIGAVIVLLIAAIDLIGCWQKNANETPNSVDDATANYRQQHPLITNQQEWGTDWKVVSQAEYFGGDTYVIRISHCNNYQCDYLAFTSLAAANSLKIGDPVKVKIITHYTNYSTTHMSMNLPYENDFWADPITDAVMGF